MAIFHNMIEKSMEDFMDDFFVFGNSFTHYLHILERMLEHCVDANLVLNWEKCHFMVREGIVLKHKISHEGMEVDRAKVDTIAKLSPPSSVKDVRSSLSHAGFYRRFTKDFSKIARPLTLLLVKDEFDIEIKEKKGAENLAADHLSKLENPTLEALDESAIDENFLDDFLCSVQQKKKVFLELKYYNWEDLFLFRVCADQVIRGCVHGEEILQILRHCHERPMGGHQAANHTAKKVLDSGLYWPTIFSDARAFVQVCNACQRSSSISTRDEMPQTSIQAVEIFDVWGIDFIGPFPSSYGNKNILVVIEYFSKWAEVQAFPTDDGRVVTRFIKRLFATFGTPRVLISDKGTHFSTTQLEKVLKRYSVSHRKDWAEKLDDDLWAFRMAYRTSTGFTPFRLVYGKVCHLPVELEHKALWALKTCNFEFVNAGKHRQWQLNELEEWRDQAYGNSLIYKKRTKKWHDKRLRSTKELQVGDSVLLYNS
eukprot:XP_015582576.1 uncharacterized protein K02A2.6-like [Ricinus communis]